MIVFMMPITSLRDPRDSNWKAPRERPNIDAIQRFNDVLAHHLYLKSQAYEQLDQYGFVIIDKELHKRLRANNFEYAAVGCKNLCRYMPTAHINARPWRIPGYWFCVKCSKLIPCVRCGCCGNKGRNNPRHRRDYDNYRRH